MGDASVKMEPYFRVYSREKKKKTTLRIIINLEKPMGNEALTNQRHLLRMLVEQRITIEGGIQTVIELRGKKGMWQYIM